MVQKSPRQCHNVSVCKSDRPSPVKARTSLLEALPVLHPLHEQIVWNTLDICVPLQLPAD